MKVYVIQDHAGKILSVHRTPDGVAHFAAGHADGASIGGAEIEIDAVDRALSKDGTATVSFSDGTPDIRIEYHAILV